MDFFRKRNIQEGTGEPYDLAFTQTEILERGWTVSMVRRHLGQPNAVICCPLTYQYDRRRVYAAEATPALQFDLLALEDVRLLGTRWLTHYRAYIPNIMRASLLTRAARETDPKMATHCTKIAASLPPARGEAPQMARSAAGRGATAPLAPRRAPAHRRRPNGPVWPILAVSILPTKTDK